MLFGRFRGLNYPGVHPAAAAADRASPQECLESWLGNQDTLSGAVNALKSREFFDQHVICGSIVGAGQGFWSRGIYFLLTRTIRQRQPHLQGVGHLRGSMHHGQIADQAQADDGKQHREHNKCWRIRHGRSLPQSARAGLIPIKSVRIKKPNLGTTRNDL